MACSSCAAARRRKAEMQRRQQLKKQQQVVTTPTPSPGQDKVAHERVEKLRDLNSQKS